MPKFNSLRAVRTLNVPLLMAVIWLVFKFKVWRAVRPLNVPLLMAVIWLLYKYL